MLNLVLAQREACFEWRTWDSQAFFACARYRVATLQTSHSYGVFCRVSFGGCSASASIQVPWLVTNLTMPKAAKKSTKKAAKKPKATKKAAKKTTKKAKKASPKK